MAAIASPPYLRVLLRRYRINQLTFPSCLLHHQHRQGMKVIRALADHQGSVMDHFRYHPLLALGLLLIGGYLAGRTANFLRLPRVTGYIVAGLIFSPSISGILSRAQVESLFAFVSEMALSIIAYAIGGSLRLSSVKALGKPIIWISIVQALGALVFVALAIYYIAGFVYPVLHANGAASFFCTALIMGAISAATAPAVVLAVVHELRATGALTTTLLGVVALDDALTVMLFAGAITVTGQILHIGEATNMGLYSGVLEIVKALAIGALGGYLLPFIFDGKKRAEINLVAILGAIFLLGGLAPQLGFSPLLANMMMGFIIVNRLESTNDIFRHLITLEETVYCLFFSLAGAHFDIAVLSSSVLLGLVMLLSRFSGKFAGTVLGAHFSGAPLLVRYNLGLALLPQAGISLGLIFVALPYLPSETSVLWLNAMLAAVVMNQIISPPLVKLALNRAGEINLE